MTKRFPGSPSSWALAMTVILGSLPPIRGSAGEPIVVPPDPLTLEWCLERAASANPEIAAGVARADAAHERVGPQGALEDPRFSYEASNIPVEHFDFNSTPLSGHQLGLRQKLPFPGMLSSRRDAARASSEASLEELADRRRRVAGLVEMRWASLGFAQRALEITDRNLDLLRQLASIAEVKYRVGTGLQQDVLRAQVALTNLLDDQLRRTAALGAAEAALAGVLDLSPEIPFPRTDSLAESVTMPDVDELVAELDTASPAIRAARDRITEAEESLEATKLAGLPDFDLGIGYRIRRDVSGDPVDGDDFVSAGVTVRLPVDRSKWRSLVAESRAEVRHAEAALRSVRAELRARLRTTHAELIRADRELELLETGLVPQARQSLDSSRSGYEVGRVDFLALLDSQVQLLDAELRTERARADRRSAYAGLEATLGEKLR